MTAHQNLNSDFQMAFNNSLESLRLLNFNGDTNLIDLYLLAKGIQNSMEIRIPYEEIMCDIGIDIVECVENVFIKGELIREISSQELNERTSLVIQHIRDKNLLPFDDEQNFLIALFIWHSCLRMAKLVRETYVINRAGDKEEYTHEMRMKEYNVIISILESEEKNINCWFLFGVSIAKPFKSRRNEKCIEDWIPEESPYWG